MNVAIFTYIVELILLRKKLHKPPSKKKKRGENLSPRNRKACHSISTLFYIYHVVLDGARWVLVSVPPFRRRVVHGLLPASLLRGLIG
jgi:hypothetical protein